MTCFFKILFWAILETNFEGKFSVFIIGYISYNTEGDFHFERKDFKNNSMLIGRIVFLLALHDRDFFFIFFGTEPKRGYCRLPTHSRDADRIFFCESFLK